MTTAHNLDRAREALDRAIHDRGSDLPRFEPLDISPYVAMSLLQKAIRRDRVDLALGSSARLLDISPERLWRRLAVTAFEDLGVADLDTRRPSPGCFNSGLNYQRVTQTCETRFVIGRDGRIAHWAYEGAGC